jgi:hypothetical protein
VYIILATIFFVTIISGFLLAASFIFNFKGRSRFAKFYLAWLVLYFLFVAVGTGPQGKRIDTTLTLSPYKLPWSGGYSRFVSQGNRSFTSHRGSYVRQYSIDDVWKLNLL